MADESDVCITGSLLSSLIFRLKNAPGDAEGFLLGEVRRHSVESITDSQAMGTREEKKLCIQSFVCLPQKYSFYDHFGRPDFDKIESLLGSQIKFVVGWFSYRRNSTHRISLRERAIHRRLMTAFSNVLSKDFLFFLVTEQVMEQSTVHSTEHSFHHWLGSFPQRVNLELMNLRASAAVPYQTLAAAQLPATLQHYTDVLQEHRSDFLDSGGQTVHSQAVETLYRAMIAKLEPLCMELTRSAAEVVEVGSEVERLREKVNSLQKMKEEEQEEVVEEEEPEVGEMDVGGLVISNMDALGLDPADVHALLLQPAEPSPRTDVLIDLDGDSLDADDSTRESHDNARQSHDLTADYTRQSHDLTADYARQSHDLTANNPGQSRDLTADYARQSHDLTADNPGQSHDLTAADDTNQSHDLANDNTKQSHDLGGLTLANQMESNLLEFEGEERHQQPSLSPTDSSLPQQSQELF